ncbi:MAG: MFS transporter [Proteobacteria bacterium]|nr:MFS transporter [Pseudomonadota bacterium]MCL2307991.1 MFS transporter [Pseudomonadota bacterium]
MPNAASSARPSMTATERSATINLAGIFGLRMMGMFIILPVFAFYAETIPGGDSHLWIGIALGIYGLTQALLQVPFGWASDRFGRKPLIYIGLLIFALGSFVAAWAPDIFWVVVGRTLQGVGAISGVVIALAADLTRPEVRTRAMAVIGITIGTTFALSLMAGPVLKNWIGVPGIFVLTGVLALVALAVVRYRIPEPQKRSDDRRVELRDFNKVLMDPHLLRLNIGILSLHAILMALFVQVPFDLRAAGLPAEAHWQVYLPVLIGSVLLMIPAVRRIDQPQYGRWMFSGAIAVLLLAQALLMFSQQNLIWLVVALLVFFTAFNLLEATLPALVSKQAPVALKGTATGVYSSLQFLGAFVGAAAGGALAQYWGEMAVFALCLGLSLVWLIASLTAPRGQESGRQESGRQESGIRD